MRYLLAAALLFSPSLAIAQQAAAPAPALHTPAPTLRTATQIVIVDVTVEDRKGKPIRGLTASDFVLTEEKHPQTVRHFEEHSNLVAAKPGPEMPPMPPGTFTNYTSVPPSGALNILLLDSLNTPMKDQSFVRQQLGEFVKHAQPGARIAIFGLSSRLFLLQGFSSDPETLKNAVQHKLIPRASALLDDPAGTGAPTTMSDTLSDMGLEVSSNLTQFEAETTAFQTQLRLQYTLDAFNTLAHYLSSFPGRKNLIWFSGAFPINILPDANLDNPFSVMEENDPQFRETTNLLAKSQVAVYPVDARGLMTNPMFEASQSGSSFARNPSAMMNKTMRFEQNQMDEHLTMDQLAEDTGGKAFYNNNDLSSAVANAIESGSNYYTLIYTPTDKDWNGNYRSIHVSLAPNLTAANYRLNYRHGYYADDPNRPMKKKNSAESATTTAAQVASTTSGETYARAAMAHGAPTPEDILFKVRVLPASTSTEETLAPNNQTDPLKPLKGPYRRMMIDYAAPGGEFNLTATPEGHHTGAVEFSTLLYDNDGRLLNATGTTVKLNMTPETYARFRKGVAGHLEISVPVKGESFLRIGIRDVSSNHIGVVEVPASAVAKLPPATPPPPATAPAAAPPTAPAKP